MKCDTIAAAILAAFDEVGFKVPLSCGSEGTNVEQGKKILAESGRAIKTATAWPRPRRWWSRRRRAKCSLERSIMLLAENVLVVHEYSENYALDGDLIPAQCRVGAIERTASGLLWWLVSLFPGTVGNLYPRGLL